MRIYLCTLYVCTSVDMHMHVYHTRVHACLTVCISSPPACPRRSGVDDASFVRACLVFLICPQRELSLPHFSRRDLGGADLLQPHLGVEVTSQPRLLLGRWERILSDRAANPAD